jgi:hypothetical protein
VSVSVYRSRFALVLFVLTGNETVTLVRWPEPVVGTFVVKRPFVVR